MSDLRVKWCGCTRQSVAFLDSFPTPYFESLFLQLDYKKKKSYAHCSHVLEFKKKNRLLIFNFTTELDLVCLQVRPD